MINDHRLQGAIDNIPPTETEGPDTYVGMEFGLCKGDGAALTKAVVERRAVGNEGQPVGIYNSNPLLDSRIYEVEFVDGSTDVLMANIIAENILSQIDDVKLLN